MEWVAVIARTIDCNAWAETRIKDFPHHEFEAALNTYSKNLVFCASN